MSFDIHQDNPEKWVGIKIGKHTVLKKVGEKHFKTRFPTTTGREYDRIDDIVLIKCDVCGEEKTRHAKSLRTGKGLNCRRCPAVLGNIGKRNGKLVVKEYFTKRLKSGFHKYYFKCDCDCGKESICAAQTFNIGEVNSCKECRVSNKFIIPNLRGRKIGRILASTKASAKARGHIFDLDKDFLLGLLHKQDNKCYLSGISINIEDGSASVDRIDSSKGYTKDNVQWLHRMVNFMKNELSQEDFIEWCNKISEKNKGKPQAPAHFESFTFCG